MSGFILLTIWKLIHSDVNFIDLKENYKKAGTVFLYIFPNQSTSCL